MTGGNGAVLTGGDGAVLTWGRFDCTPDGLRFACVNARSVRNKAAETVEHVVNSNIDLCIITETWLKEYDCVTTAVLGTFSMESHSGQKRSRFFLDGRDFSWTVEIFLGRSRFLLDDQEFSWTVENFLGRPRIFRGRSRIFCRRSRLSL